MGSRSFISSLLIVIVLSVVSSSVDGLSCKVCAATKSINGHCRVMPCNSIADVNNGLTILAQQQKIQGEMVQITDKRKKFVCVRSVGKGKSGSPVFMTSACAPLNPKFPPSDKPYKIKDYSMNELDSAAKDAPEAKLLTGLVKQIDGDVYVCDDKVGNGPNCGEKSVVSIKH